MKIFLNCLTLAIFMGATAVASEIPLADGHIIKYSPEHWDYHLSENTFNKSIGLLEAKDDLDIRGIIDTEVRFVNPKENVTAGSYLAQQCADLRSYWDPGQYEVLLYDQSYCIVRSKSGAVEEMALYQVLQAKVSRSRKDMIFVYSWTFHVPSEKFEELSRRVEQLREIQ